MPDANIEAGQRNREEGTCELVGVRTVGEAIDALFV